MDPLTDIEDKKAMKDLGRIGYFIMIGAIESGANIVEASLVTSSYFAGLIHGAKKDEEEKDEETPSS